MATKLATGVYQMTAIEGLTLQISAVGTGFTVDATVGTASIPFAESGDTAKITPAEIGGAGVQTVNIRCFFSSGATPHAEYELLVIDDNGALLDDIKLPIVTTQSLPYQALIQLALIVRQEASL